MSYGSVYGTVESRWEGRDGKTVCTATIPANCTAVLNDDSHICLAYGWDLGMDTHAPLMKLVMPKVMRGIFNKSAAETSSKGLGGV